MFKILILIFLSCSLTKDTKDLIIIGDYRVLEMATTLMGVELTTFKYLYTNYAGVMTREPVEYEDYNLKIIGTGILESLITVGEEVNKFVQEQLKSAEDGTNVLLSVGIQHQSKFNDIFVFYGKLADKYPKLNFYVLSLIGVDESLAKNIKNTGVKEFNKKVETRIEVVEFPNMKYKSILNEDDPTQIIVDGEPVDIINYVSEGIGFFKTGYAKIFKAMVEWL